MSKMSNVHDFSPFISDTQKDLGIEVGDVARRLHEGCLGDGMGASLSFIFDKLLRRKRH
jgi:hypothetical protein